MKKMNLSGFGVFLLCSALLLLSVPSCKTVSDGDPSDTVHTEESDTEDSSEATEIKENVADTDETNETSETDETFETDETSGPDETAQANDSETNEFSPDTDDIVSDSDTETETDSDTQTEPEPPAGQTLETLLPLTDDAGVEYLDRIVFFGESTTAHWVARGNLTGGKNTKQVLRPEVNTLTLNPKTATEQLIIYPETGEQMTLGEAVTLLQPEFMIVTIGINDVNKFAADPDYYEDCYTRVIDVIRSASPDTKIILQSSFPINRGCIEQYPAFGTDLDKTMASIHAVNERAYEIAVKTGCRYLNTYEVMTDESGYLAPEFDNGDGLHLSTAAYVQISRYIRTHAWIESEQ